MPGYSNGWRARCPTVIAWIVCEHVPGLRGKVGWPLGRSAFSARLESFIHASRAGRRARADHRGAPLLASPSILCDIDSKAAGDTRTSLVNGYSIKWIV